MDRVLILGVGNILFTDEGIGVHALEWLLSGYDFPENVRLLDGGTLGTGLMDALMECDRVYVLDAVLGGDAPGSVYRLADEHLRKSLSFRDSLHQTDLVDTLLYCEFLGHRPEAVVYGMEPFDYQTMAVGLSSPCEAQIPKLCASLLAELRSAGIPCTQKNPAEESPGESAPLPHMPY